MHPRMPKKKSMHPRMSYQLWRNLKQGEDAEGVVVKHKELADAQGGLPLVQPVEQGW